VSGRFDILETPIKDLVALRRLPICDERGFLERVYCEEELAAVFGSRSVVQINRTLTRRIGTVRGLHFQHPPHSEMKMVSCTRGSVFDVAVDLRRGSPTFLSWHGRVLSADNRESLVIPEGFAHGFQTLEPDCEMLYLHTARYVADAEDGIDALDAAIGITWPMEIAERSRRDARLQASSSFEGIGL